MLHASLTERVTTPDGVSVSVSEWGNPEGPEIVFIHGAAQSSLSFARQCHSELARDFRLVAYDLRGHGFSDKPRNPKYYREGRRWADEAQAVIDAKRLKRPVMVGWSLGGRVLREYLMAYGDRGLSGINILAARPFEVDAVVGPGSKAMMESTARDLPGRIAAAIAFLRACFDKQPDPGDFVTAVAYNFMIPFEVRDAIAGWKTDPAAVRAAFAAVTVPTLITHGRRDSLILPLAAEMCADAIKGARISWYDDCGHSPFYEDAPRYNRELAAFAAEAWRSGRG
ncbi:MAG: alpha/beta hydrolase [Alphaproteobacteria bacterium]|nr:alpha/beta hydrolase [Alphaproteobacteria bacterium]